MNKIFALLLLTVVSSMTFASYGRQSVPKSLRSWTRGDNISWDKLDMRCKGAKGEDWRDKFSAMDGNIDAQTADVVWEKILQAKTAFHQDNLWILTSGNDSLVAAMIDVEWAFDGIFLGYFSPISGSTLRSVGNNGGFELGRFVSAYDKSVARKVQTLLEMPGLNYDFRCESVRFAESIKKWCIYNSVAWNDNDSLAEECPEKYYKQMGRKHQRADVRSEWFAVQNSIRNFHEVTQWVRDKNNAKINKALDDFEESFMAYFRKYVKEMYRVEMNKTLYMESMPMAVDVLCMEYVNALREEKK